MITKRNPVIATSALAVALAFGLAAPAVYAGGTKTDKTMATSTEVKRGQGAASVDAPATHGGGAPDNPAEVKKAFPQGSSGPSAAEQARQSGERMKPATEADAPPKVGGSPAGKGAEFTDAFPRGSQGKTASEKAKAEGERLKPATTVDAPPAYGGSAPGPTTDTSASKSDTKTK